MKQKLYSKAVETHLLLEGYINIHDEIFVIRKGVIGIVKKLFEPIDYKSYSTRLSEINSELGSILTDLALLDEQDLSDSDGQLKDTLTQFIEDLIITIRKLSSVSKRLSEKADGKTYPSNEYKSDIREYQNLINIYQAQGINLNRYFH